VSVVGEKLYRQTERGTNRGINLCIRMNPIKWGIDSQGLASRDRDMAVHGYRSLVNGMGIEQFAVKMPPIHVNVREQMCV